MHSGRAPSGAARTRLAPPCASTIGLQPSRGFCRAAGIGAAVRINDRPATIVGILPRGFAGLSDTADVWIPMGMLELVYPQRAKGYYAARGARWHQVVGRLKPGVSLQQASADLSTVGRQLELSHPATNARYSAAAFTLKEETVGDFRPVVLTLL